MRSRSTSSPGMATAERDDGPRAGQSSVASSVGTARLGVAHDLLGELCPGGQAELGEGARQVGLNGARRDEESLADLFVAQPVRDEAGHLALRGGERGPPR